MKIEVINDINEFKDLKNDWDNLLEKSNINNIFLTWEWLYYWWIHFRGDKELLILLIKDETNNQIMGIAPFCIEKERLFSLFSIKKIKFLGTEKVASDFLDFIIYAGFEVEVLRIIYEYLDKNSDKWDIIEIEDIEENSKNIKLFKELVNKDYKILEQKSQVCPYIKLPESYELLLKTFSLNMRSNLKRQINRLQKKDKINFFINHNKEQIKGNIDKLFILHNTRFKTKNKDKYRTSSFSGDKIKHFHYDIAEKFLLKNWLKFYSIKNGEELIACLYAFKYKDKLFYYQSGFNPDWHKQGLGNALFDYALRDSIKEGLNEFHYLRGNESYKSKWTKTAKKTLKLTIINNNIKSNLYANIISSKIKLKKIIKNMLK